MKNTITIVTHSGHIQDIQGIPEDTHVEIKDYGDYDSQDGEEFDYEMMVL